ncbi:MAG: S28 family serine protease [Bacteroidota bacterium]
MRLISAKSMQNNPKICGAQKKIIYRLSQNIFTFITNTNLTALITKMVKILVFALLMGMLAPLCNLQSQPTCGAQTLESTLLQKLKNLPGVVDVTPLNYASPFKEKYQINLKQWLDASDTAAGWFLQRVFVSHLGFDAPTVLLTEGYTGDYATYENYTEELASLFHTNQIFVEHRYFGKSVPNNRNWNYLTSKNAAADHHHVTQLFKTIYTHKWIATGISKGGQTALIYRTLYPNDVDITVCYVAPLCFGVEDGRHEPFILTNVLSKF